MEAAMPGLVGALMDPSQIRAVRMPAANFSASSFNIEENNEVRRDKAVYGDYQTAATHGSGRGSNAFVRIWVQYLSHVQL
jgi:hypothetical protein